MFFKKYYHFRNHQVTKYKKTELKDVFIVDFKKYTFLCFQVNIILRIFEEIINLFKLLLLYFVRVFSLYVFWGELIDTLPVEDHLKTFYWFSCTKNSRCFGKFFSFASSASHWKLEVKRTIKKMFKNYFNVYFRKMYNEEYPLLTILKKFT